MNESWLSKYKRKLFAPIHTPEILKPSYYAFIDGLRGLAIISVIITHVITNIPSAYGDHTIGVQLFFIISGFLITTLLLKEKIAYGKVSLKKFYIRRSLRIFPVAYLYIFVVIILNRIFSLHVSLTDFLATIFYVRNFPLTTDWYGGHFWTLSIEEQFYLLVPIILARNLNLYIKIMLVLLILTPTISYLGFNNVGPFYTNKILHTITFIFLAIFDRAWLYLLSGSLLAILLYKGMFKWPWLSKQYYLSFVLFLSAIAVHFPYGDRYFPYVSNIGFTVLILMVFVLNLTTDNFLNKILKNPLLVKIGVMSYSLYVWQQLFTWHQPWAGHFKYADAWFINVPVLFVVAYLSYHFYESRFLKLKSKFTPSAVKPTLN
jgi:peptidoglycan/LPS O-acetylase OafA/YrhL